MTQPPPSPPPPQAGHVPPPDPPADVGGADLLEQAMADARPLVGVVMGSSSD